MSILDKLLGRHKDTEQQDPNLPPQQGGQQGQYEYSQDMGTAQSTIGQQPQGGYQDPNQGGNTDPTMSNPGSQDPNMGNQDPNMSSQDPNMSNQGYQDPNQDPDMGDEH
jgi:hypothetical protein